jgi:hypothetical protein
VKQAKATLAKLNGTTSKGTGSSKKPSKKHKEAAATAGTPEPNLQAIYQLDLEKAKKAAEKAKVKVALAAQEMFQLYKKLLSIDAKYARNKIVLEQTQSYPITDLQGVSRREPREYFLKTFDDCMIFHLLTVFPNKWVSRRGTTSQMCARNPSVSSCISLCSMWSSSTPTSRNYHAGTTVSVSSPVQLL